MKVGIIGLVSFAILFVLVFLLTSSTGLFQRNVLIRTYMDDASGMIKGTPVRLNGIGIGYLDEIQLTGSRDPKRAVGFLMKVRPEYLKDIPADSIMDGLDIKSTELIMPSSPGGTWEVVAAR